MFRKSMATLLAVFLPLVFSLQACGRKSDNLTTIGGSKMSDIQKTLCEAVGDKDTDGDGICDRQDDGSGLNGPLSGPDPKENKDANNNGINDGKETWWKSNHQWVLGTLAGFVSYYLIDGFATGKWVPFKDGYNDGSSNKSDPSGSGSAVKISFGNYVSGESTVMTNVENDKPHIMIWTKVRSDTGLLINDKNIGKEVTLCIRGEYSIPNNAEPATVPGFMSIQIHEPLDFLTADLASIFFDSDEQLKVACNSINGIFVGIKEDGKPWYPDTLHPEQVGFGKSNVEGINVGTARIAFVALTKETAMFKFVDTNDAAIRTRAYTPSRLDSNFKELLDAGNNAGGLYQWLARAYLSSETFKKNDRIITLKNEFAIAP